MHRAVSIVELYKTNTVGMFFYVIDLFCFNRVCIHIAYLSCSNPFGLSVVHCVFVLYAAGVNWFWYIFLSRLSLDIAVAHPG